MQEKDGYTYQIATPEKALCDKLYTLPPVRNMSAFKKLLLNDLQIKVESLETFNLQLLRRICDAYHATNVSMLYKFLIKRK